MSTPRPPLECRLAMTLSVLMAALFLMPGIAGAEAIRKAILSEARGQVEVRIKEGAWQPAKVGMVLHELDELRTAKGATAQTLLDDKGKTGKLEVKENSHIRFHTMNWDTASGDNNTMIDVALGKVKVYAKKLSGQSKFEVNTPTAVLAIRGTVFEVKVWEEKGRTKKPLP